MGSAEISFRLSKGSVDIPVRVQPKAEKLSSILLIPHLFEFRASHVNCMSEFAKIYWMHIESEADIPLGRE